MDPHTRLGFLKKTLESNAGGKKAFSQMRKDLDNFGALFQMPKDVRSQSLEICGCTSELFIPENELCGRILLYLHGGGYVMGSIRSHRHLASRIAAAAGTRTLLTEYCLAPEHPYPAAIDTLVAIYQFLLTKVAGPHCIALAGDSAGGGLCISLMLRLKQKSLPLPKACAVLSPWVDLTLGSESWKTNAHDDILVNRQDTARMAKAYLNHVNPSHPLVSGVHGDLKGLPAMLIHVGSKEVLLDDAVALHRRAKQFGVNSFIEIWNNMPHVWHFMAPLLKEGQTAVDRVGTFLDCHMDES